MNFGTSTRKKAAYQVVISLHSCVVAAAIATLVNEPSALTTIVALLLVLTTAAVVYMTAVPYSKSRTMTYSTSDDTDRSLKVSNKDNTVTFCYTVNGNIVYEGSEDECPDHIREEISEYRRACMHSMISEFEKCGPTS